MSLPDFSPKDVERFWSKVIKTEDPNACWIWTGSHDKYGYGYFSSKGKSIKAHRIAYILTHGSIPDGMCICHTCDVRNCVRIDHLFAATSKENTADRDQKGRTARGERSGAHTHPEKWHSGDEHWTRQKPELLHRGESHGMAKFTEDEIRELRRRYDAGGVSISALARECKVALSTMTSIIRRTHWKHIE
jgi:hypothetical protein